MQTGWQNQGVLANGWSGGSTSVANVKAMLQEYGPVVMSVCATTDFYWPGGTVPTSEGGIDHDIVVVGWHDATSADAPQIQADGGYWIIKNQWGTGWGSYGGYSFIPYGFGGSINYYTAPAYYTGAMATATWQGGGGVWASGSGNWTSSGSAYSWVNQETAAIFNSGSNNAISISGTAIAHALIFNAGPTSFVLSGGSLTVTAGGILANNNVTINSGVTIGAPQTWTTASGQSLLVNGSVSTILSTLTVGGAGATTINGVIGNGSLLTSSGGGLTMQGPGSLTLTASNVYSGGTTVSGGLLWLSGSGAIGASSGLSLVGGTLRLDNSTLNNSTRIPSNIAVTLGGGEMSLTGNTAGTTQLVGSLSLQQGFSTITVTPTNKPAVWSTGMFSRGIGATALLRGPSLGSGGSGAVGQILFSNTPTLTNNGTGTSTGIIPYFIGDNSSTGNGTDLVTYVGGYGAMLLSSSQYSSSIAAGTNVKLSSTPAAISSNTSVQALVLTNTGSTTQLAVNSGDSLTLTSGALLSTGSTSNTISGGSLTVGTNSATSYQGVIYTASNLTIGSAITNDGSNAVSITKSGPATLSYTGANTYSGGTTIVGGTLQVASGGSLISSGSLTIGGGDMPALSVTGGTISSSYSGNAFYLGNIAGQTGVVNVSAGIVSDTSTSGSIMLGDSGTGIWNQTGGTTTVANQITAANQIGSAGQLNVNGGYVSAANGILVTQSGSGSLTVSGSGFVTTPSLAMVGWNYSPATAALNLNGGTLSVGGVYETSGQTA